MAVEYLLLVEALVDEVLAHQIGHNGDAYLIKDVGDAKGDVNVVQVDVAELQQIAQRVHALGRDRCIGHKAEAPALVLVAAFGVAAIQSPQHKGNDEVAQRRDGAPQQFATPIISPAGVSCCSPM